jgi:sugar lactone lactonase YvrE
MPSHQGRHFAWARRISCIPAVAVLFSSYALAAVPAVVVDAEQTIGSTNSINPQQVVIAPNGIVYVADTNNNQVLQYIPNLPATVNSTLVKTPGFTLAGLAALAVDASGDLYIADTSAGKGRIIEVMANANGILTTTVTLINSGGPLVRPQSLVVDSSNTVFVGDLGTSGNGDIYSIAPKAAPVKLTTGTLTTFSPGALARDSASDLYFVNSNATSGGVFEMPIAGGTTPTAVGTGSFTLFEPGGLVRDSAGDLFILATIGGRTGNQGVLEIPAGPPATATPYLIPASNLQNLNALGVDLTGNLYLVSSQQNMGFPSSTTGNVTQLNFANPVDMGTANVSGFVTGNGIVFNFEFNAPNTLSGFRSVTGGDSGSDVTESQFGGTCSKISNTASATQPTTCFETFEATPQFPGIRVSSIQAIQVIKTNTSVLSSTPVFETGKGAAQVTYPMDTSATPLGLTQPEGIAVTGFDKTVYVADLVEGAVYSIGGLNGSSKQTVSTAPIALQAPSAVAINGEGDLFIADFNLGEIVVVPANTANPPHVLNTGNLLQHPISLALDFLGDLYIGDAGPFGDDATSQVPGYVVEVPYSGPAFTLPIPGVSVVFPQALVQDSISGNLLIGDGGDVSTGIGQVVRVPANGGNASVVTITGTQTQPVASPTDPTGLVFDAAENMYVLDGFANTVTVVSPTGAAQLLNFNDSSLVTPSGLVSSAGSQSFVIANMGDTNNNSLVFLNGNSVTFAFGSQTLNSASPSMVATVTNIGNVNLDVSRTYDNVGFPVDPSFALSSTNCSNAILAPSAFCSISIAFDPTTAGAHSEQVTINSNAYNANGPAINLSGSGVGGAQANLRIQANVRTALVNNAVVQTHINKGTRKSFKFANLRGSQR